MSLFFFLVYGSANEVSHLTGPHPSFSFAWEADTPFIPVFIIPYMSLDLLFIAAIYVAPTRRDLKNFAIRSGLAIVLSSVIFLVMPMQFSLVRREVTGWAAPLFGALGLDRSYNQFPSLHISLAFLTWHVISRRLCGLSYWVAAVWFLLIRASTVLVYQHHAIDLVGGALVAVIVARLAPDRAPAKFCNGFTTPRHLAMALRYLLGAAAAALTAFSFEPLALPLGWTAISLACVAASYALGLETFLSKRSGAYPATTWLLFWPYLLGSQMNWRFWRSRVSLTASIAPGVWIGARPTGQELSQLKALGVRSVVDLAPELPSSAPGKFAYDHLPMLDVVIPSPEKLNRVANQIEARRNEGDVYIHCVLGLSRSVLAAAAWLMRGGKSKAEAIEVIDRVRPGRVRRSYMSIALDGYERHLARMRTEL